MDIKEKDIQKAILQYLRLKRIFCWKQNNVGIKKPNGSWIPSQMTGVSDILGVLDGGRILAIEVKTPKGVLSPSQSDFLYNVNSRGGLGFVAHSLEEVIARGL